MSLAGAPAAISGKSPTSPQVTTGDKDEQASLHEAREIIPPPLRCGTFQPKAGAWVEFKVTGTGTSTRARLSHVADVKLEGKEVHQLELEFVEESAAPLIVVWITTAPPRLVLRLALVAPPSAPVSIPLDLPLTAKETRGTETPVGQVDGVSLPAPFAGSRGRKVEFKEGSARLASVVLADVPLVGLHSVRVERESWVALEAGSGAQRRFSGVPIQVPRMAPE
ncbi:MAG: hypothetical protein HY901_16310 [Deltaproteobacteria bacterium]|nr:hypothetical protein [Deltaproteobacteria bacterium]